MRRIFRFLAAAISLTLPFAAQAQTTPDAATIAKARQLLGMASGQPQSMTCKSDPTPVDALAAAYGPLMKLEGTIWASADQMIGFEGKCAFNGPTIAVRTNGLWAKREYYLDYHQGKVSDSSQPVEIGRDSFTWGTSDWRRTCAVKQKALTCTDAYRTETKDPKTGAPKIRWQTARIEQYKPADAAAVSRITQNSNIVRDSFFPWFTTDAARLQTTLQRFSGEGRFILTGSPSWVLPRAVSIKIVGDIVQVATFEASGDIAQHAEFRLSPNTTVLPLVARSISPFTKEAPIAGPLELTTMGNFVIATTKGKVHYRLSEKRDALLARDMRWDASRGWIEQARAIYRLPGSGVREFSGFTWIFSQMADGLWRTPRGQETYSFAGSIMTVKVFDRSNIWVGTCQADSRQGDGKTAPLVCRGETGVYKKRPFSITFTDVTGVSFTRDGVRYEMVNNEGVTAFKPVAGGYYQRGDWLDLTKQGLARENYLAEKRAEEERIADERARRAERRARREREAQGWANLRASLAALPGGGVPISNDPMFRPASMIFNRPSNPSAAPVLSQAAIEAEVAKLKFQQVKREDEERRREANAAKPVSYYLTTVPPVKPEDKRQPRCYSRLFWFEPPSHWTKADMGESQMKVELQSQLEVFARACASARRYPAPVSVLGISLYAAWTPEDEDEFERHMEEFSQEGPSSVHVWM